MGLAALALLLGAVAAFLFGTSTPPPVDPAWAVAASADVPPGSLTVRFTGTSTLLFSDGETAWMVDGWFSRFGARQLYRGKIAPDGEAIARGLERNGIGGEGGGRLAAVIPVHSHFDHAMDAPEVAKRTGAILLGSPSTANIGRGWGLPESQIRIARSREPERFGRFEITLVETRHFEFPDPAVRAQALERPEIEAPLVPPVAAFDYRLGTPYAIHVRHPLGTFLIQGSAGYVEGGLAGYDAELVFLGIGGLGTQTADYRETYWRETVVATGARRVIPVHWDSLMGPIEGPFVGEVRAASLLSSDGDRTLAFLKQKLAETPGLRIATLPRYDEVVLFPGMGAGMAEAPADVPPPAP
ncbi:MAG: MBL fold metallo-hydrolase [Deltaproteobacteria bacterium]|nr:MBL fold metallo-hydrolase [Deltaproteobacteria bacterium]